MPDDVMRIRLERMTRPDPKSVRRMTAMAMMMLGRPNAEVHAYFLRHAEALRAERDA